MASVNRNSYSSEKYSNSWIYRNGELWGSAYHAAGYKSVVSNSIFLVFSSASSYVHISELWVLTVESWFYTSYLQGLEQATSHGA